MKTCKKCSRSEPTIIFSSLAPNYCIECYNEEHRKATAILDSYNEVKKSNDEISLKKTIEYAEGLKEYHFEGILDLVEGVKNLDRVINICKEQLGELDKKRERERESKNPLLDKETLFFGGLFIIAIIAIIYHYHNKNKPEKEKNKEN